MILLSTLNARYIHSSLGLRYLYANLGALQSQAIIREFTINQRPIDIAEQVLETNCRIAGFGVYIWNVIETTEVISILKALRPEITIILGGPEISHETELSPAYPYADHIIQGQADLAFADLCRLLLNGPGTDQKVIRARDPLPTDLALPYTYYNDEDIRQRVIYVEASRGCPFKCEFCLSALDKTARPFDLEKFLAAMEGLYQRGARHFKFVDRTFNLNIESCSQILEFFLARPLHDLHLHFELIPDRLPDPLKALIRRFPDDCLQFEIGIQSFDPEVQQLINRKQAHDKTLANLTFLRNQTRAHLHTDLIAGLPGENLASFARGFDLLCSLRPHEIQLGILKRLRGTPISRHESNFAMIFNPNPPYNLLSSRDMDADSMFRINRFARYWDMIANSGRFANSLPALLGEQPFANFMALSDWLFATTAQTHRIALPRLFALIYEFGKDCTTLIDLLRNDFDYSGIKGDFERILKRERTPSLNVQSPFSRQQQHRRNAAG